jgi:hypothetical protein
MSLDHTVGDTLALVNVVREAFGHAPLTDLPDARPGDSQDCLYFRALKDVGVVGVGTGTMNFSSERQARTVAALWGTQADGNTVHSPRSVKAVINAFDNKKTPRYNV